MSSAQRTRRGAFVGCPEDQYFDPVVEHCGACVDICTKPATMMSCRSNCPGYLNKSYSTSPEVTSSARTSYPVAAVHVTYRLIDKPLFWTSVVSMSIALLATIGIIVLCVLRWRAAGRRRALGSSSRHRQVVRNRNIVGQTLSEPDERRSLSSEKCSSVFSGSSTTKNKNPRTEGSDELLVSLHSNTFQEFGGHLTGNQLEYIAQMATVVSEEKGSIHRHPGTDVRVSAKAPHVSIESCPYKSLQQPKYIRSTDIQSINTSYWNNTECWMPSSTMLKPYETMLNPETSVKHLSVEDVSSDNALLSLMSQDNQETVLPLAHVPGCKPHHTAALDFHEEDVYCILRSETGYRSGRISY